MTDVSQASAQPSQHGLRRRWRRFWISLVVILLVFPLVGWAALRFVLPSRLARAVATQLESTLGAVARVDSVDVGLVGSTIRSIEVYEARQKESAPWVTVREIDADVSLTGLVLGKMFPSQVTLRDASIILDFDSSGRLKTQVPQPKQGGRRLPRMYVVSGRLTLKQEGRSDFVVQGIHATLEGQETQTTLEGKVDDPYWGTWAVNGLIDTENQQGTLTLVTQPRHVTQTMLEQLPFVPLSVWKQVQLEGNTSVKLTLEFDMRERTIHYEVDLQPDDTTVHISSINLDARRASGQVAIRDNIVELAKVSGRTADGEIKMDARLNFQYPPSLLKFAVQVRDLDIRKLPKTWSVPLPPHVSGRLTGHANLQLTIRDGKAETEGNGRGQVDTSLGSFHVPQPIQLRLRSDGQRFRFTRPGPESDEGLDADRP